MLLVRIAMLLVAIAMGVATLLGNVAAQTPGGGLTLPPACLHVPLPASGNLQVGYCP